jgi:hypothetical protein
MKQPGHLMIRPQHQSILESKGAGLVNGAGGGQLPAPVAA